MPGERRESSGFCTIPVARNSTLLLSEKSGKDDKERNVVGTTSIPLPKNRQYSNVHYNHKIDSKFVKTEKNRLRLIMQSNDDETRRQGDEFDADDDVDTSRSKVESTSANDKEEQRKIVISTHDGQSPSRRNANRTIPRYQSKYSEIPRSYDKKEETPQCRYKHATSANPERTSSVPSALRVGVEGRGSIGGGGGNTSSFLHPWETPGAAPSTRDIVNVRPYYVPQDPPLSREHITAEHQPKQSSASTARACLAQNVSGSFPSNGKSLNESRCSLTTRGIYRNQRFPPYHHKEHEMDTNETNGVNLPNSGTPSPEPYTRTTKCYDEDASSEEDGKQDDGSQHHRLSSLYHGTWPVKRDLWTSQQMSLPGPQNGSAASQHNDMASVMSFSSSTGMSSASGIQGHRRLGAKVDVVYSLLGMLGSSEGREDMSATLLAMSASIDSCLVMRQSGCLPLLVQLIHAPGQDMDTRERASRALHNVIQARSDEKVGRREARVLRLLEQIRDYCQALRVSLASVRPPDDLERHPGPTIAALMKLSFDEAHRHAMCQLGGLHAVAELIEMDHASHGSESDDQSCVTLRRYAGMALTNLTFGDGNNKALLCSFRAFMKALVSQLQSLSDDLRQVTASVLRNLSWRADSSSKQTLREVGAVTGLMRAAMEGRKESTLKSILSALWNLSAHCSTNKVDICAVEGALAFLVDMLSYKAPSKTLSIVENAGGILRNVSSHIAVREDYRKIVRERDCLQVLLRQLRSPSLTVVSNACGALWNLSARCPHDQRLLWDLGAVPMLRSLVHSKHKMISMGSSAALKNLLSARPAGSNLVHLDSTARGLGLPTLPTLVARRQRALEQEIDQNLAETCDNIEPSSSPINKDDKFSFKVDQSYVDGTVHRGRSHQTGQNFGANSKYGANGVSRSESRESVRSITSTQSDTIFERVNRHMSNGMTPAEMQIKQQSSSLHSAMGQTSIIGSQDSHSRSSQNERKYALRYKNSIPERLRPTDLGVSEIGDLRCTTSTMSWATGAEQESACSQIFMQSSVDEKQSPTDDRKSIERENVDFSKTTNDTTNGKSTRYSYKSTEVKSPIGNPANLEIFTIDEPIATRRSDSIVEKSSIVKSTSVIDENSLIYAETDIDRPTDYSLRYAEINSDEDEKQSSGYFAGSEQDIGEFDTVKTYCTEGTPCGTSLTSSGAASDNDLPDNTGTREISRINYHGRIDDVAREIRRDEGYLTKKIIPEFEEERKIFDVTSINRACNDLSMMTNRHDSGVIESSESLADSDHVVAERRQTSPCHSEPFTSGFDVDTASSIDATVTRLNSLVLNDEPKIINDSTLNDNELRAFGSHNDSLDVESFPNSMISDGEDDDEDLLAACIHVGMQNSRHRQSFRRNSLEKTPPSESNLARYQTSAALDQVEINGYVEHEERSLQSDSSRFNIRMSPSATDDGREIASMKNEYACFEDNFNVAKDDDKITVEYQKLQEYSCDPSNETIKDSVDGNIATKSSKSSLSKITTKRETRANSVEDNLAHDSTINEITGEIDTCSNNEIRDSESIESFDSVERSEQALLQLCIKSASPKTENIIEKTSTLSNSIVETADSKREISRIQMTHGNDDEDILESSDETEKSRNNATKNVQDEYRRQRDPDAMIASLDRLTATLVQQTEAMRERESSAMKQSVLSDTWNEDSPNDVSYPSISVSAPLIGSFKSDIDEDNATICVETLCNVDSVESTSMTNSRIIEREAIRLSEFVSAEATRQRNYYVASNSLGSCDIESTRSLSTINDLASLNGNNQFDNYDENSCSNGQSTSLSPIRIRGQNFNEPRGNRKKSLPIGVMAKRALAHDVNHTASLESLLNDCSLGTSSQLENVAPPSLMDEIFDNADMENSMLSVASITSEIADSKDHDANSFSGSDTIFDLVKPVANVLSLTCMRYAESMQTSANDSISEYLENINPPSLFNEISDIEDSTIENTETMCSDTLCIDVELRTDDQSKTMIVDRIDEQYDNDTDDAATPITTESCYSSSAESTPKKRSSHKNHLTPKQKRQLAKERFKTYTIAAELVKKEEEERRKNEQHNNDGESEKIPRCKLSPFSKLTPKQRRQEDPARFQTQVLENPFPLDIAKETRDSNETIVNDETKRSESVSPIKSSIPTLTNLCGGRTFRKKRSDNRENGDRYRTRTLNDVDALFNENSSIDNDCLVSNEDSRLVGESDVAGEIEKVCEIQTMLEKNANIVLNTLNETSKVVDLAIDETMLDCETLSLVSNDSESEQSLRMRCAGGLGKRLMTNYVQRANKEALQRHEDERAEVVDTLAATIKNDDDLENVKQEMKDDNTPEISDSESEDSGSRNAEEHPQEPKRPRIVKPGTFSRDRSADSQLAEKSEPSSPRGIRGRRRALYSNPNGRKITPQTSPLKQANSSSGIPIGRGNPTPIVRATRATTLRQNTNTTFNNVKDTTRTNYNQRMPQSTTVEKRTRNVALSKRSSIPQRGTTFASGKVIKRHSTPPGCTSNSPRETKIENQTTKPLERQGTFTKDEPEVENAPTVVVPSPSKSKIAKSTKGSPVRGNPSIAVKSKISVRAQHTVTKCSSTERIQSPRVSPSLLINKRSSDPVKCQNDQGNLQSTITTGIGRINGARRIMSLGQRSNSNSSIVSTSSTTMIAPLTANRKLPKEATSKIASLWKKVEESKSKQRFEKPDTRQWITGPANNTMDSQDTNVTGKPPAFRLYRSSTFEGVSQESDDIVKMETQKPSRIFEASTSKYRNSCDLTGIPQTDATCKIPVKFQDSRINGKGTAPIGYGTIVLRKQRSVDSSAVNADTAAVEVTDCSKRISRLGSFIRVDSSEAEASGQIRTPASAIVPPFNYNPRQETPSSTTRRRLDENNDEDDTYDFQSDIVTASTRVTTV